MIGETRPDSSLMATAMPIVSSDTPSPEAMVARNGGAKRKQPFAAVRANVRRVMRRRTSSG